MPDTQKFELVSEAAHALALLPEARSAIRRIYNRDRGRYHAAALTCRERNNPALSAGRAEQQVLSLQALGILVAGEESDKAVLLRAAMRRAYDDLIAQPQDSQIYVEAYAAKYIPDTEDSDIVFAKIIVIMTICAVRHLAVQPSGAVQSVVNYANGRRAAAAHRRHRGRNEAAIRLMRERLGVTGANGITGLYDRTTDEIRASLESTLQLINIEGIDSGEYTTGVLLSPVDAELVVDCDTAEQSADRAALLMLARAVRMDRDFCLSLYRDSNDDELLTAKHEAETARREANASRARISELEAAVLSLRRELEAAQKQLESRSGDADELTSLRDAVYAMNRGTDEQFSNPAESVREIPAGVIAIGGHPQWARMLTEETGVRVWPTGTTCPASVIQSASELWIQAAYMAHSEYYGYINQARRYGIPVRYFPGTGVGTCVDALKAK